MIESNKAVKIPCPCCSGTSFVELAPVYLETLAALEVQPGEITGVGLARIMGCTGRAMANRLVALERSGVALGRRIGRVRLWKAVPRKENEENIRKVPPGKVHKRSKRKEATT
jgi:hypothetical protein